MITIKKDGSIYGITPSQMYGLSKDEKPLDVGNASVFFEMDTGNVFMFDKENKQWREL